MLQKVFNYFGSRHLVRFLLFLNQERKIFYIGPKLLQGSLSFLFFFVFSNHFLKRVKIRERN